MCRNLRHCLGACSLRTNCKVFPFWRTTFLGIALPGYRILITCISATRRPLQTALQKAGWRCVQRVVVGIKPPQKWGIKPPPTPFLAIFDPYIARSRKVGGWGGGVGGEVGGGRGGVEKVGGGWGGLGGRGGGRIIHTEGGAHTRRGIHKAVHTQGGLWPPQESCYLRGHGQGGTHRRRCTHKAEHTKGGLWPPQESCYLRGHKQGGAHRRRCTQKVVHTQGGTHKRRSVATAGVLLFKGPQARRYTQKAVHTQGGAHKRRSVATAGVMLFKGGAGAGPRVERSEPSVKRSKPRVGGGGRGGCRGGATSCILSFDPWGGSPVLEQCARAHHRTPLPSLPTVSFRTPTADYYARRRKRWKLP